MHICGNVVILKSEILSEIVIWSGDLFSSDKDHDGIVTQEEFAALPPGEVDEQWKESDRLWQEERKKEFKEVIDLNKDGIVTKDELKVSQAVERLHLQVLCDI